MTEPKVVHEWEDGETEYKLLLDGSLRWEQVDIGSRCILEGSLTPSSITKELARLAARVQELEKELEKRGELLGEVASDLQHVCRKREAAQARVQELEADMSILGGEATRADNKRLRDALGEYGHHKPRCKLDPCDCGILEALREKP